ncbi:hypothetical protein [Woodsholea maritima]|uniref:hypothetical protein n=1 Tax=Woodsholea maritima TaxID=240237 RepID=UPI0003663A4C|nr:hypothetical protein [Woodsholea maritima]
MSKIVNRFSGLVTGTALCLGLMMSVSAPSQADWQDEWCDSWFWCAQAQIFPDGTWCSPRPPAFCQGGLTDEGLDTERLNAILEKVRAEDAPLATPIVDVIEA